MGTLLEAIYIMLETYFEFAKWVSCWRQSKTTARLNGRLNRVNATPWYTVFV